MAENKAEVLVGAMVLAVGIGFAAFASQSTGLSGGGSGSYELSASFRSVQGVNVGTDVRIAGVKVGQITGLALNPTTFRADATLSVQEDLILPDDSAILVSSEGLLGGNYIEIVPGGSPFDLEPVLPHALQRNHLPVFPTWAGIGFLENEFSDFSFVLTDLVLENLHL